jgi:hypothetical protein
MTGSPKQGGVTTQPNSTDPSPATQRFFSDNCTTRVTYDFLNEIISIFLNAQNYLGLTNLSNDPNALKKMFVKTIGGEKDFRTGNIDLKNPTTDTSSVLSFLNVSGGSRGYLLYNETDDYFRIAKRDSSGTTSYIDMYDDRVHFSDAIKIQGLDPFLKRQDIEVDANLNDIKIDGYYNQNLNKDTSVSDNYPVNKAGTLTVKSDGDDIIYQTYQTYDSTGIYYRSYYLGTWYNWRKIWDGGNDGAGSGLDAALLDGANAAYFTNSSNQNAGILPNARLANTIPSNTTGNAATASDAALLGGANAAYFTNSSNQNAGILPNARLADTIPSNTTGNAATASKLVTPNGTITDFKEGAFTPNINCFSSAVVAEGRYQKIQNVINLSIYFELNDANRTGTGATLIRIGNVPYLSSVITQKASILNLSIESGFYAFENNIGALHALVDASNDVLNFIYYNEFDRTPMTISQLANWTGIKRIRISGQLFLF